MSHLRKRYLEAQLQKALHFTSILGVLGHRQSGKTTITSQLSNDYVSLDRKQSLLAAQQDPEMFLSGRKEPFVIDECQYAPELFPELKESVRLNPKKGRFILTGSVRFTSRKAIRESLTGRIINYELLPLSWSELSSLALSELPLKLLKNKGIEEYVQKRKSLHFYKDSDFFLKTGGLPGICLIRDTHIQSQKFDSHIETILERDLRLLLETSLPYSTLLKFLSLLAHYQAKPLDLSELSRSSRISRPTITKLLSAFESLFLIRRIFTEGGRKRPVIMFEDQGIATHLNKTEEPIYRMIRLMYANIFPQFHYRPELNSTCSQYLTLGGAWVPLVFKTKWGVIGYIPELNKEASMTSLASARSFLKHYKNSRIIIAHQGDHFQKKNDQIFLIPMKHCF